MTKNLSKYKDLIRDLAIKYGLTYENHYETVTEFLENDIPLFKLVVGQSSDESLIILTFHLDIDAVDAVQWYQRVKKYCPEIHLTASYLSDSEGNTYIGQEAHAYQRYLLEQEILAEMEKKEPQSEEEAEDAYLDDLLVKAPAKPEPKEVYTDRDLAFREFKKRVKQSNDTEH